MIMPNSYLHDGEQPRCPARHEASTAQRGVPVTYGCELPAGHAGSHQAERLHDGPLVWEQAPLAGELFKSASNRWSSMGTAEWGTPGAWRPGRQQPRNFYEGDRYVGVAFDPVDTRRVIDAMNAPTISSELRDKADTIAVQQAERFRQLGKALDVDISGQTWDDLIRRVQLQRTDARDKVADYRERNSTLARMYEQSSGEREYAESEVTRLKTENECLRPEVKRLADSRDEVRAQLTRLQVNSQCPSLLPTGATDAQLMIYERKCVRVNGHAGAHIRTNGSAW